MNIYTAIRFNGYEFCYPRFRTQSTEFAKLINGTPRSSGWRPVEVMLVHSDGDENLAPSDAPWFLSSALIFRNGLTDAVRGLLLANGELLELACPEADLLVFNATNMINALDYANAETWSFPDGSVSMILKHAFLPHVVEGMDIFRITGPRVSSIYFGQKFVDAWIASGAKGLDFTRIWSNG